MNFTLECEREDDGRWLAEVPQLPGVLAYGASENEAMAKAEALALRVMAERHEHAEAKPMEIRLSLPAAAWASDLPARPGVSPFFIWAGNLSAKTGPTGRSRVQAGQTSSLPATMAMISARACLPELPGIQAQGQKISECSRAALDPAGPRRCEKYVGRPGSVHGRGAKRVVGATSLQGAGQHAVQVPSLARDGPQDHTKPGARLGHQAGV